MAIKIKCEKYLNSLMSNKYIATVIDHIERVILTISKSNTVFDCLDVTHTLFKNRFIIVKSIISISTELN